MKKLSSCGRSLSRFCLTPDTSSSPLSCLCFRSSHVSSSLEDEKPLMINNAANSSSMKLKDVLAGPPTLAFQLKPKIVVMRVSMHCSGCAKQVKKHISKLEGVSSYEIDLETNMVVVTGDIVPSEVLQSVSKVKMAWLWNDQNDL